MPSFSKKLHEKQSLGRCLARCLGTALGVARESLFDGGPAARRARLDRSDQNVPRSFGVSVPVTQSEAPVGAQLSRFSAARAKSSASFGSFPAVNRVSRSSMQPIAVRRAGQLAP